MPSNDRRLLSATVTLALVAFVWPMLVRLGTFRLEAVIGTVLALAWVTLVALVLERSGWQRLWLAMLLPFVVWWPLMFGFMAACTQDGSCP